MLKTEWTVGPNKLQFLPPDIFFIDAGGPTTLADMKEAMRILEEEVYPEVDIFFFFVRFARSAAGLSPEVREYHFSVRPRFAVMMLIGGNPMMRAALTIASRAIRLWNNTATEMRMVKTLEEALALADEIRAKKAADGKRTGGR